MIGLVRTTDDYSVPWDIKRKQRSCYREKLGRGEYRPDKRILTYTEISTKGLKSAE